MFAKTRQTLFVSLTILWWVYMLMMLLLMSALLVEVPPETISSLWESLRQDVLETFSPIVIQETFRILVGMLVFGGLCYLWVASITSDD